MTTTNKMFSNRQITGARGRVTSSSKVAVLGLVFSGLMPLLSQTPDLTIPIRDLLDRQFPTQLLQEKPELALGMFVFVVRQVNGSAGKLSVNRATNTVEAKLAEGKTLTWSCSQNSRDSLWPSQNGVTNIQCMFSDTGEGSAILFVTIERHAKRVGVHLKADSNPRGESLVFIGTELPDGPFDWMPHIDHVDEVQQALFVAPIRGSDDPQFEEAGFGRYVFDSRQPVAVIVDYLNEQFRSRGFVSRITAAHNAGGAVQIQDGLLRVARFEAWKLPNGKSRCDLFFIQGRP